jgi:hypothetical protein
MSEAFMLEATAVLGGMLVGLTEAELDEFGFSPSQRVAAGVPLHERGDSLAVALRSLTPDGATAAAAVLTSPAQLRVAYVTTARRRGARLAVVANPHAPAHVRDAARSWTDTWADAAPADELLDHVLEGGTDPRSAARRQDVPLGDALAAAADRIAQLIVHDGLTVTMLPLLSPAVARLLLPQTKFAACAVAALLHDDNVVAAVVAAVAHHPQLALQLWRVNADACRVTDHDVLQAAALAVGTSHARALAAALWASVGAYSAAAVDVIVAHLTPPQSTTHATRVAVDAEALEPMARWLAAAPSAPASAADSWSSWVLTTPDDTLDAAQVVRVARASGPEGLWPLCMTLPDDLATNALLADLAADPACDPRIVGRLAEIGGPGNDQDRLQARWGATLPALTSRELVTVARDRVLHRTGRPLSPVATLNAVVALLASGNCTTHEAMGALSLIDVRDVDTDALCNAGPDTAHGAEAAFVALQHVYGAAHVLEDAPCVRVLIRRRMLPPGLAGGPLAAAIAQDPALLAVLADDLSARTLELPAIAAAVPAYLRARGLPVVELLQVVASLVGHPGTVAGVVSLAAALDAAA